MLAVLEKLYMKNNLIKNQTDTSKHYLAKHVSIYKITMQHYLLVRQNGLKSPKCTSPGISYTSQVL